MRSQGDTTNIDNFIEQCIPNFVYSDLNKNIKKVFLKDTASALGKKLIYGINRKNERLLTSSNVHFLFYFFTQKKEKVFKE